MRWMVHVAAAMGVALALQGCGSVMTIGPTPATDGIIIYLHADYAGPSEQAAVDIPDLGNVEGPCVEGDDDSASARWDDCVSSVKVMPGWRATLFRDRNFKGASVTISQDMPNLQSVAGPCSGGFNDCVSSIRIERQ